MYQIKEDLHCKVIFGQCRLINSPRGRIFGFGKSTLCLSLTSTWYCSKLSNLLLQCVWLITSSTVSQLFSSRWSLVFILHGVHCFAARGFFNTWHFKNNLFCYAILYFTICPWVSTNNRKWKLEFPNNETKRSPVHGSLSRIKCSV